MRRIALLFLSGFLLAAVSGETEVVVPSSAGVADDSGSDGADPGGASNPASPGGSDEWPPPPPDASSGEAQGAGSSGSSASVSGNDGTEGAGSEAVSDSGGSSGSGIGGKQDGDGNSYADDAAEGESGAEHDPEAVVDPDELPFTWSGYGSYGEDDWSYDMEWSYEYCSLPHPFSRGRSLPALHSPSPIPTHPTHL